MASRWLQPPSHKCWGVRDKLEHSCSHFSREALNTTNKATGLIMLEHSHLAIEFYNFKFRRSPWYSEDRIRGAIHAFVGHCPELRSKRRESLRTRKNLSNSDQSLALSCQSVLAFSTEALTRLNRGAIAVVLPVPP